MNLEDVWMAHLRQIVEKEAQAAGGNMRAGYRSMSLKLSKNEEYIYQLYKGKPKADGSPRKVSLEFARALERHYAEGRQPGWINIPPPDGSHAQEPHSGADAGTDQGAAVAPITTWPFKSVGYRRFMALPREARAEIDTYLESIVLTWERKVALSEAKRKRR